MDVKFFCRVKRANDLEKEKDLQIALTLENASKRVSNFGDFEHVFSPEDGQDVVFSHLKPLATQVLSGHNVCLMPYGSAGSGKYFTMSGEVEQIGLHS